MPNGCSGKKYGPHDYGKLEGPGGGTQDCRHGCGCWVADALSGGPIGLDSFGTCPHNPEDGQRLGGQSDYETVVEDRISELTSRALTAEEELKAVDPDKRALAAEVKSLREQLRASDKLLAAARRVLEITT